VSILGIKLETVLSYSIMVSVTLSFFTHNEHSNNKLNGEKRLAEYKGGSFLAQTEHLTFAE